MKKAILDMSLQALKNELKEMGAPAYRAKQIRQWMIQKQVIEFKDMTNLPLDFRQALATKYHPLPAQIVKVSRSEEDGTIKFVSRLLDGRILETVVLKYHYGYTVCISSQIGCAMGCAFCASTREGLVRNCTATEMLAQVLLASNLAGQTVRHVVVMGIGEPLHNYDELIKFLHLCRDTEWGLGLSMRNITVSTCGLVPEIKRLANENLPITLALSLHAPNDGLRKRMMPIARHHELAEVMEACDYYFSETGRRVSYEYILIDGLNDTPELAQQLATLLRGRPAHVNLIPLNRIDHQDWQPSSEKKVKTFANVLESRHISVTVRRSLGNDIEAACGQLRSRMLQK